MSHPVYFDNAATTPLAKEVLEAMMPYLSTHFGNPSSTYSLGRTTRLAVETARKTVAQLLGTQPGAIYFTSGGTESNNTAIAAALRDLGCDHIITSPTEHHAVLHTVEYYSRYNNISYSLVKLTPTGEVDYENLAQLLQQHSTNGHKCLVSLMHANNEIGSLLDMKRVADLCKQHDAVFHSDCVQTVGHYPLNLSEVDVHFISGAGHKFHGPKGVGILYVNPALKIQPLIYGGGQERNMRAGTENVYGITGFAKALELAMQHYEKDSAHIASVKSYMKQRLQESIPGVRFNSPDNSLYTVLSVCFPKTPQSESLLLELDMQGVCVSGGSACSSGSGGSHVIQALGGRENCTTIRFSFSKYNTKEEVDQVIGILKNILNSESVAMSSAM
jgi:cysteine desulfurase